MPDLELSGSPATLLTFTARTRRGMQWLRMNCEAEPYQWRGASLVVEPRCAVDIVIAAEDDGLAIDKL